MSHRYDRVAWERYARVVRVYGGWYKPRTVKQESDDEMRPSSIDDASYQIGIDGTPQFCMWEGMPCLMRRESLTTNGTTSQRMLYEVRLTRLGRNRGSLLRLLRTVMPVENGRDRYTFSYGSDGWRRGGLLYPRTMESVIIREDIKRDITASIEWFRQNEDWYLKRGIPYKLCILLTGEPGNGKSSLIRALATQMACNVYSIALPHMSDESLARAIQTANRNDIVVLEDFNHHSLLARNEALAVGSTTKSDQNNTIVAKSSFEFLTLRGFLNVFDGLESLHGKIIILTTNVVEELDRAVIRKGRVDRIFQLNHLTHTEICRYIQNIYPDVELTWYNTNFAPISGADLQALYLECTDDAHAFITSIPLLTDTHGQVDSSRNDTTVVPIHRTGSEA